MNLRRARPARERWGPAAGPWVAALGLALAVLGAQSLAGLAPPLVERYYSRGLYPHIGRGLSFVSQVVPFSIGEWLLILLLPALAFWLARPRRVVAVLLRLVWLAGGAGLLFLVVWGLNYQRQPLGVSLDLGRREASAEELEAISRALVAGANRNYGEALGRQEPAEGSRLPMARTQLYEMIEAAYQAEPLLGEVGRGRYGPPKPVYFSSLLTRLGIAGIYSPFTGEPNYNAEQPDCDLPHAIAHEKAHQRGFAREDEANFAAFLVCVNAADPYVRYSGYQQALRVVGLLSRAAPERAREIWGQLGPGPRADLRARSAFWRRREGRVLGAVARRANDAYLRANRVESGIRSYDEVTAMIISYYLKYPVESRAR